MYSHFTTALRLTVGACTLAAVAAQACPSTQPGRFVPNGAEVLDTRTGLIWQRCSAGQTWNGETCTGRATDMNYDAAWAYAKSQPGWRLPNVKELFSLVDRACFDPVIDATVFPATATSYHYLTSTPSPYGVRHVNFEYGKVDESYLHNTNRVRLVRSNP